MRFNALFVSDGDFNRRLIHGYDAVDLDILWDIVQYDLPPLIEALEEILRTEPRTTNSANG